MTDSIYHRLFSHPIMVEQLVREFVPEAMAAGLDFSRMERVNAKFHASTGSRREGDVIWRIPTVGGEDVYLYLLCEFQSTVDWWMPVRTQVYEGLLWQHVIAEKKLKAGDRLPPVLMLLLYNGEPRWLAPADIAEMIALPPGSPLWPWQPRVRYHLLDMGAVPGDDLASRDSLAALLFRLEQPHEPDELADLIDEVVGWFRRHPGYEQLKSLFTELVRQAIEGFGTSIAIPDDLVEMQTMLAKQGEVWKRRWLAEGKAEGKAEIVLRQLRRKHGPLSPEIEARVRAAGSDQLDVWSERLLDARELEDMFGDPTTH
ncbi:MAG: Rpn family recombination-promoting nuclease/putative transposase [Alphaproteobacteria bacterium]